jgi:protein mraZ
MTMPSRHREALAASCALEVTITRHPDGCLLVYPRPRWEEKRAALAALPYSARFLQRIVLGSAVDLALDKAGRLLIPADLRTLAGIDKDVALVGMGEHFEIWDAARLAKLEEEAAAAGFDAAAGDFQF